MNKDNFKIAAVVVTYNRLQLLNGCIDAIKHQTRQLDEIIVVNNTSTDGTLEWLTEQKELTIITQENSGSAGGQYTGIKTAYEKGYDWIWCMDDDAEPEKASLETLVDNINGQYSALCSLVVDEARNILPMHRGLINLRRIHTELIQEQIPQFSLLQDKTTLEIDFASFVGILINARAIKKVGLPKIDLFIYHDDVEYCIRLKKTGKILLVTKSMIMHKEIMKKLFSNRKTFFSKTSINWPANEFWRFYYSFRNFAWIVKNNVRPRIYYWLGLIIGFTRNLKKILFYNDYKLLKTYILILALAHGLNGNLGRSNRISDILKKHKFQS